MDFEWDERPLEQQRPDPIVSKGHEFPKGQIAVGESFDVCVEGPGRYYSECKTLTNLPSNQPEEVIFSID